MGELAKEQLANEKISLKISSTLKDHMISHDVVGFVSFRAHYYQLRMYYKIMHATHLKRATINGGSISRGYNQIVVPIVNVARVLSVKPAMLLLVHGRRMLTSRACHT